MKKLLISLALTLSLVAVPVVASADAGDICDGYVKEKIVEVKVPVKEEPKIVRSMEMPNPNMRLSQLTGLTSKGAYIKIFSGLSVADVTRLWNDLIYLRDETEIRVVDVFINSPGGDAFSGLALSDLIEIAQDEWGFTIRAHASGIIASAAVPVFAVCKERLAADGTIFMVHEAALWKWPGRETASDIASQNELMHILRDRYIGYLVDNSTTSKEDWEAMEKKTTWFNVDKARELGLIERN
jgi:ATP-dependent protease ClpP protease subunit